MLHYNQTKRNWLDTFSMCNKWNKKSLVYVATQLGFTLNRMGLIGHEERGKLHAPFSLKQSITICSRFVMIFEDCSCGELHETHLFLGKSTSAL